MKRNVRLTRPFSGPASGFLLACLAVLGGGEVARAADLDVPPPVNVPQDEVSNFFGSGWYIRGDIGYSAPTGPSGSFDNLPLTHVSWASAATADFGVGYKITNWFRADVTADYLFQRDVHFFGSDPTTGQFFHNTVGLGGYSVMANGYFDIGTWSNVTPYVGGGVGYAFLQSSTITSVPLVQSPTGGFTPVTDPITGAVLVNQFPGHTRGSFAWALMAGASVDLGEGLKFDVGYRYMNITDGALGGTNAVTTKLKNLGMNQFRVGFRYAFDQ